MSSLTKAKVVGFALAFLPFSLAIPPAQATLSTPTTGTIQVGVGAAGVKLGMTKTQLTGRWGAPARCSTTTTQEVCTFKSSDGVERAIVALKGSPRTVSVITIPFSNATWVTAEGIHVGSTAYAGLGVGPGAFDAAYGSQVDASRSTYYSRYVPGTSVSRQPRGTRFTLGWFNEYFPDQYFGVAGITVQVG